MGFGFPSAIGAQMGNPDKLVVSINGDGGIQMCSQELAICAINNIPVKIVIINNQVLGNGSPMAGNSFMRTAIATLIWQEARIS